MHRLFTQLAQSGHTTGNIADGLTVGSAVTYGYTWLADLDHIVSITAGVLVAVSAALSIWLHIRNAKAVKDDSDKE